MRAILIDPEKQSLTEIELLTGYREIIKVIGCKTFTIGAYLGSLANVCDIVDVSDDDLEDRDDPRFWFQVDADRDPPSSFPIAGRGLATGVDKAGETCAAQISVDELRSRITFTQRKFRGLKVFKVTDDDTCVIGVEVDAPIIDGTNG